MTSEEKKLTVKRILIFLVLSFVPVYLISIFGTNKDCEFKTQFGRLSIMWYPAIANFVTRAITKEGLEDSCLRIKLKGHGRHYAMAILLPMLLSAAAAVIEVIRTGGDYSFARGIKQLDGGMSVMANILLCLTAAVYELDRGFGEEFGWRAYLTPKMEKLMPSPLAITVSGIIWGLWHAPLIAKGYNFGKEVHPALGIAAMCLSCVVLSFILTWLTKRTGSVYPAAIFHIVYDAMNTVIYAVIVSGAADYDHTKDVFSNAFIFMCIVPLAAAVPMAVLDISRRKCYN